MSPYLALVIANLVWGAGLPVFKHAFTNIPPFTLAYIRFFFAAFIFLPFISYKKIHKIKMGDWIYILVGSFFNIFINISFLFIGLTLAPSINAAVIGASGPVLLFILSVFFLKERPQKQVLTGMLISLVGACIIILLPFLVSTNKTSSSIEGNILYVVATLGAVLGPLFLKRVVSRVSPYDVIFFGFLFSSILFAPFMWRELQTFQFSQINQAGLMGILYGVFGSSATAYFLQAYALSKINAQETGVFSYLNPVAAVIVAIPLLMEYPDMYFYIGSTLVFVGILISEKRMRL